MNAKHLTIDGKSVVRLAIGEGVVWKGLPAGYTYLDYIETNGTQYIDTGFILNQDSRVVCEYMYKGGNGVYGARNTVQTRNFSMRVINNAWQFGYGDGVTGSTMTADTTKWHIADQNKNVLYIDGNLAAEREYAVFTTPKTMAIGAIKAGSIYYGMGRYRGCQVYDNGVLVRDLIPCKDADGNIGMYDTLNAKFYGNAGTGEFVAGESATTTSVLGDAILGTMILGS